MLSASERAVAAEPWLRETPGLRLRIVPEAALTAAAGTRDHQGVVAWCEPYRYADAYELAAGQRPLLACLDGVTDPHNLGAVCRSAEGAGATGVVITERNAARIRARIIAEARNEAQRLREEVDDYVDTALANFEQFLTRALASIERGRDKMHALREIGTFQGEDSERPLPF